MDSELRLFQTLAECCISGKKGANINLGQISDRHDTALFGEGGARIIVSIPPTHQPEFEVYLGQKLGNAWQYLGEVGTSTDSFQINSGDNSIVNLDVAAITHTWSTAIERRLDV